jgi:hypothetical protein
MNHVIMRERFRRKVAFAMSFLNRWRSQGSAKHLSKPQPSRKDWRPSLVSTNDTCSLHTISGR